MASGAPRRGDEYTALSDLEDRVRRLERSIRTLHDELEPLLDQNRLWLPDSTAPSAPTGGGLLYVQAGELKYRGPTTDSHLAGP